MDTFKTYGQLHTSLIQWKLNKDALTTDQNIDVEKALIHIVCTWYILHNNLTNNNNNNWIEPSIYSHHYGQGCTGIILSY